MDENNSHERRFNRFQVNSAALVVHVILYHEIEVKVNSVSQVVNVYWVRVNYNRDRISKNIIYYDVEVFVMDSMNFVVVLSRNLV